MQKNKTKRADILNTAVNLYYQRGFNSIGVDRIIIESKVAKMTYYKYFPAKVDIYEACLNHEIFEIKTGLIDAIESLPDSNYLGQIDIVIDWFYTRSNSVGYNGMLYQKAKAELIDSSCILIIDDYYMWLNQTVCDLLFKAYISNYKQKTNFIITLIDGMLQAPYLMSINDLKSVLYTILKS
ncbi:TetR/AcrR family transcriptional regulator (plasmid) [Acinetobacter baumannii]